MDHLQHWIEFEARRRTEVGNAPTFWRRCVRTRAEPTQADHLAYAEYVHDLVVGGRRLPGVDPKTGRAIESTQPTRQPRQRSDTRRLNY